MWPQYVSTVDSGNFAGHLIALKQACIELPDDLLFHERVRAGLSDTLAAITKETSQLAAIRQRTDAITIKQLGGEVQLCAALLADKAPETLGEWSALLEALYDRVTNIDDIVAALALEHGGEEFAELRWWTSSLLHEVRNYRRDLGLLAPWTVVNTPHLSLSYTGAEPVLQWRSIIAALPGRMNSSSQRRAIESSGC